MKPPVVGSCGVWRFPVLEELFVLGAFFDPVRRCLILALDFRLSASGWNGGFPRWAVLLDLPLGIPVTMMLCWKVFLQRRA